MRKKFSISGFLVNFLVAAVMASVGVASGSPVLGIGGGVLYLGFAVGKRWMPLTMLAILGFAGNGQAQTAGINREVWENHIEENLFSSNEFMMGMTDQSEYVNNLTVHVPQAGAAPNVIKNRTKGGARTNTNVRVDTTLDWNVDEYTTDPFLVTNAEEVQLSYSKMDSILYEQEMQLRQVIGDNMLISIAPTGTATLPAGGTNANILRSTGITGNDVANVVSSVAYTPGATGNRLNFTLFDIRAARKLLNKQNLPKEDRTMVCSSDAIDQLINDLIATKYRASLGDIFDVKAGTVNRILGFDIIERNTVCTYNGATNLVNPYGTAGAATDNDAILFWQKAFVAKAIGDIHVYETLNSAVDYGDVYSGLVRMGATKLRSSEIGIGAIVQGVAA